MSTCDVESPFASLSALRAEHRQLQKIHREAPESDRTFVLMESFICRGVATGAILDDEHDQAAAQSLLDFWATTLYRANRPVPESTLAAFDPTLSPTLDEDVVPYVGLDSFVEQKRGVFFGREHAVASLVSRLREHNLIAVIGPSGSGKSSLVLAGLLPALKAGALPGSGSWTYLGRMVPGSDPLRNLARFLRGPSHDDAWVSNAVERLRADPGALVALVQERSPSQPTVLVIDQFEEVSTLCEYAGSREIFERALVRLVTEPGIRRIVVLTMRSDFIGAVARHPSLQQLLETALEPVMPLTAAELREAIERPAQQIGLKFEQGVVEALVHDILGEPAALPLLQFTLLKLWERREHNRVTLHQYRELGGGRKALTRSADKFMESLVPEDRVMADRIFLRLVRPGTGQDNVANRVRRRALYSIGPSEHVDRVLDKLITGRLIRLTGDTAAENEVEIAHEALVRNWEHLVMLLDRDRDQITAGRRLEAKAAEWVRLGRGEAGLLKSVALLEAEQWMAGPDAEALAGEDLRALVAASRIAEDAAQRRQRRAKAALRTLTAVSLTLAVFAVKGMYDARARSNDALWNWTVANIQKENAEKEKQKAELAQSEALAAKEQADNARKDAEAARQQAERARMKDAAQQEQILRLTRAESAFARIKARLYDADGLTKDAVEAMSDDPELAMLRAIQGALLLALNGQKVPQNIESVVYQAALANRLRVAVPASSDAAAVAFSPDSRRFATGGPGPRVNIWDAVSGTAILSFPATPPTAIAYSWDHQALAVAGKAVQIFNPANGALLRTLLDPSPVLDRLTFSPDGRFLAGIGSDARVHLWRLTDRGSRAYEVLQGHTGVVRAIAFSPTGALLATGGSDKSVRIWATESGDHVANVADHPDTVTDLLFHPDGQRVISGSDDRRVRVSRLVPRRLDDTAPPRSSDDTAAYPLSAAVKTIGVTRDGLRLLAISADGRVATLELPELLRRPSPGASIPGSGRISVADRFSLPAREAAAFRVSPDGSMIATAGDPMGVRIWSVDQGSAAVLGVDPDGIAGFVSSARDKFATTSATGNLRVWDLARPGRELVSAFAAGGRVVALSPDGERAAVLACQTTAPCAKINVYHLASQQLERTIAAIEPVSTLAFNADATMLVSGNRNTLQLWDASSGAALGTSPALPGHLSLVAFSPDNRRVAAALVDGKVALLALNGAELQPPAILGADPTRVLSLAFSPDGRHLATSGMDRSVRIWDVASAAAASPQTPAVTLSGHTSTVKSVAFSADGKLLVTGGEAVRIWNLEASAFGAHLLTINVGLRAVLGVRFSRDSSGVVVATEDGSLRWLPAPVASPLGWALSALTRDFRPDECRAETCMDLKNAISDIVEGNWLAKQGHVKQAVAKYASAHRMLRALPLDVEDQAARLNSHAGATALRQETRGTLTQVDLLARAGRRSDAGSLLQRLEPASTFGIDIERLDRIGRISLTSALRDLAQVAAKDSDDASMRKFLVLARSSDPSQKIDVEAEAATILQTVNVTQAVLLVERRRIPEALEILTKLRSAGATRTPFDIDSYAANQLCWNGSLAALEWAKHLEVRTACRVAVELTDERENNYRDSRGVNRARNGEFAGAIDDLEAYANDPKFPESSRAKRRQWIERLEKGVDPFTAEELASLLPAPTVRRSGS